jgi:hypothetical protein
MRGGGHYVYPVIQEDVVAMPVGQEHEHCGRYARGQGSNPIQLLVPAADGDRSALAWAATRVRITPIVTLYVKRE